MRNGKGDPGQRLSEWLDKLERFDLPDWDSLPELDLYMDQVIALLGQYLDFIPVEDQKDKPVTSTTINNYVRLKVMPAPEKRKYYRIHIAYMIMIFTLKQGTSISSLQKLLPAGGDEEEVRSFYTSYIQRVQQVGNFYTAQTRAAAQSILNAQGEEEGGAVEDFILQSVLMSGFSQILGEKLLNLRDADPERVLAQEALSDSRGLHPIALPPTKGKEK